MNDTLSVTTLLKQFDGCEAEFTLHDSNDPIPIFFLSSGTDKICNMKL